LFDQKIHGVELISDPARLYAEMLSEFVGLTYPKEQIWPAGFGHLMGYDARYYSYIWSQVYAADFFSRFEKEGVLHPATGQSLKKEVLEKGSSIDEIQIVRNFLGREPSNEAFLKQCGIGEK
jgi:thimet oligopeptidase